MSLSDGLRFALLRQEAPDASSPSPLNPVRPSTCNWMAVPRDDPALAFVYHANELQCMVEEGKILFRTPLPLEDAVVLDMAVSGDGRMVAVCCHQRDSKREDGEANTSNASDISIVCYNVTSVNGFEQRYTYPISSSVGAPDVRAMSFGSKHTLAVVDDSFNLHLIQNNGVGNVVLSNATSVSFASDGHHMAVGRVDGTIEIYNATASDKPTRLATWEFPTAEPPCPCTHLDWVSLDVLVAGYCRVSPLEGQADDDDDDDDDAAEHEALMIVYEIDSDYSSPKQSFDLGDVVPFFSVPKGGRHKFYTCCLKEKKLMLVATNLASEVRAVVYEDEEWNNIDIVEGDDMQCPTSDDEFTYPTGLCIMISAGRPLSLLASTGGSLTIFGLSNEQHPEFFDLPIMEPMLPPTAVPMGNSQSMDVTAAASAPVPLQEATDSSVGPAVGSTSTNAETAAFTFGTNQPVFGTGSPSLSFGAPTAGGHAFIVETGSATRAPFNIFEKQFASPMSPMAKPLFGTPAKEAAVTGNEAVSSLPELTPAGAAAAKAAEVFDSVDTDKIGSLPLSHFESLIEDLGEGFYGDEMDVQAGLVDAEGTGMLKRSSFISWYQDFVAESNAREKHDDDSLDSDERAERAEESEHARKVFAGMATGEGEALSISSSQFEALMVSMGTTYSEEQHGKALKRLEKDGDRIYLKDFVTWYIAYMFDEDGDSSSDTNADDNVDEPAIVGGQDAGWGAQFAVDPNSWKCDSCMVFNSASDSKCAACQTPRVGSRTAAVAAASTDGVQPASVVAARVDAPEAVGGQNAGWGAQFAVDPNSWKCDSCMVLNSASDSNCAACQTTRGGFQITAVAVAAATNDNNQPATVAVASTGPKGFSFAVPAGAITSTTFAMAPTPAADSAGLTGGGFTFRNSVPDTNSASTETVSSTLNKVSAGASTPAPTSHEPSTFALPMAPAFGSGTTAPSFKFSSVSGSGLSFGGLATNNFQRQQFTSAMPSSASRRAEDATTSASASMPASSAAIKAARVFDSFDFKHSGSLPLSAVEDLIDALGEGFYGDEMDVQTAKITNGAELVNRENFIAWYQSFAEENKKDEDDDSLDSEERAEREDESEKARQKFMTFATENSDPPFIQTVQFKSLMESLGTTYCEEVHGKASKRLQKTGHIYLEEFLSWYIAHLFDEDGDSQASEDKRPDAPEHVDGHSAEWGSTATSTALDSKHGALGFTFGGPLNAASMNFTLAPTPTAANSAPATGDPQSSTPSPEIMGATAEGSVAKGTGFTISMKKSVSGEPLASAESTKRPGVTATKGGSKLVATQAYPPINYKAPKPFDSAKAEVSQPPSKSSSAPSVKKGSPAGMAYPPINYKTPKPYGSSDLDKDAPAASSHFPKTGANSVTPSKTVPTGTSYPPSNFQAPKPFASTDFAAPVTSLTSRLPSKATSASAEQQNIDKPKDTGGGLAYPPINYKTPKPYGTSVLASFKSPNPSANSQKPVTSDIPLGFGANQVAESRMTGALSANTEFSKLTVASLAAAPKLSFGASQVQSFASASGHGQSQTQISPRTLATTITTFPINAGVDENDCTRQFARLCAAMGQTLESIKKGRIAGVASGEKSGMDTITSDLCRNLVLCHDISDSIQTSKQTLATIFGKKNDCHRRILECELILEKVQNHETKDGDFLSSQPLDAASEERRRSLIISLMRADKHVDLARERLGLMKELERGEGEQAILSDVGNDYQNVLKFKNEYGRLASVVKAHVGRLGDHKRSSTVSLTLLSPAKRSPRQPTTEMKHRWSEAEAAMQQLPVPHVKVISCGSEMAMAFQSRQKTSPASRRLARQRATPSLSPQLALKVRPEWDVALDADQQQASQTLFTPPSKLNQSNFNVAGEAALAVFGTTRSKLSDTAEITRRGIVDASATAATMTSPTRPPLARGSPSARPSASSKILEEQNQHTGRASRKSSRDDDDSEFPKDLATKALGDLSDIAGSLFSLGDAPPSTNSKAFKQDALKQTTSETLETQSSLTSKGSMLPTAASSAIFGGDPTTEAGHFSFNAKDDTEGSPPHVDYGQLLTTFYQTHNSAKIVEVAATLEKYKNKEAELFEKLSKKYGVANPLKERSNVMGSNASSTVIAGVPTANPPHAATFSSATFGQPATAAPAFGATPVSVSPFGVPSSAQQSPFSQSSPAPVAPSFPFGQTSQSGSTASPSPFGSPQGSAVGHSFAGNVTPAQIKKNPRQMLTEFYQQTNPAKLADVDKLLIKYEGKHELMFQNLANRYNLDPAVFGLSAIAPAPGSSSSLGHPSSFGGAPPVFGGATASPYGNTHGGFGQASPGAPTFGQTSGFGQHSTPSSIPGAAAFGSPTPLGGGGLFGQQNTPPVATGFGATSSGGFGSTVPAASFGALAGSPQAAFGGSPGANFNSPSPFGSFGGNTNATPFGAPRR